MLYCFQWDINAQNVKDSVINYIKNEGIITSGLYDTGMLQYTEALSSEFNVKAIGVFYLNIECNIGSVKNILARIYQKDVNCASLSNKWRFEQEEECCEG